MFGSILLSFGKSFLLWLVHLPSNLKSFFHVICLIKVDPTFDFLITQNRSRNFTKLGLIFISLLSLTRLIFNHHKVSLRCLTQLHTDFQLVPVCDSPIRLVNRLNFVYGNNCFITTRILVESSPNLVLIFTFGCSTRVPNFSPIKGCVPKLKQFLCLSKRKKKKKKKTKKN